jgi:2-aminoadipate transaminase
MHSSLIVSIQSSSSVPKYRQIAEQIAGQISDGTLLPGDRLPPIRVLSEQLSVNSATIVKAYESLQKQSLVTKIPGSGVYVGSDPTQRPDERKVRSEFDDDELYLDDEIDLMQKGSIVIGEDAINFATSTPTSDMFPVAPFKEAIDTVLDRDGGRAFEYDESNGYLPLRESICTMLNEVYAVRSTPERLQIISGAQQGIDIAAKALLDPGDCVLVEDPTYTGALAVFKSRGARIVSVPMEQDGIDLVHLEKSLQYYRPKVLYLMPDYQNPTTCSYSGEKRSAVVSAARRHACYVIEDDFLSDLSFTARSSRPLKSYDDPADERVIHIKSFSKLLMPGLRIGFLTAPMSLSRDILQAKHLTDISSAGLIQRAFDLYLRSGVWETHLSQMCHRYHARQQQLFRSLKEHLQQIDLPPLPTGGVNLWLPLPQGISASALYRDAAAKGVLCTPGNVFRAGTRDFDDHIRLSIAAADEQQIERGIVLLSQVIGDHLKQHIRSDFLSPML